MKAYLIQRKLKFQNDAMVAYNVRFCDRQEDADRFAKELQVGMSRMLSCKLATPTGEDTGIDLRTYLNDLGLAGFAHEVVEVPVTGSLVTAPAPSLVRLS